MLSGRLSLPSSSEMASWEASLLAEKGDVKAYHILGFPSDAEYLNFLHDWAMSVVPSPRLENEGKGKEPPYWDEEKCWERERIPLIKEASRKLGDERHKLRNLKDLGFDFHKWKEENSGKALL